jgi:hypothetical protein
VWRPVRGDDLLGEIIVEDTDFPWLRGRLVPGPAFAELRPLFEQELALVEADPFNVDAWQQIYDRIVESVELTSPSGPVAEFLLHVRGDEVWFRWSDEQDEPPGPGVR